MFNGSTAVLLGAGFSRWACGLPVVSDLFDLKLGLLNAREVRWLRAVEVMKQEWDVSHLNPQNEVFISDILASGRKRASLHLLWYLTRRLSDPFVASITRGFQTLMIDDSRKWRLPGIAKARALFDHLSDGVAGVITPNWDLVIEYALGTSGFNYGTVGEKLEGRGKNHVFPWQGSRPSLTGRLTLAKIHGSLSWANGVHFTDGRCGLRGKADIVPPIPEKRIDPRMVPAWEAAESILARSDAVLVFGFAFNPYDTALLELLGHGSRVRRVLLVDLAPQAARACMVWPHADISTCSPPTSDWSTIDSWLRVV